MKKRIINWIFWILLCCAILLTVSIFSLCVGSADLPAGKIFSIIFQNTDSIQRSILLDIRFPRIILGFAVGGALSLAGIILQGLFRNPLVEPYTLGISGGSALFVCLNIVLGFHQAYSLITFPISGILGAAIVVVLLYFLSVKKSILNIKELLLTGVMMSFIASALIMLIMSVSKAEDLHGIVFWIMGSLETPDVFLIKVTVFVSIVAFFISYFFCFDLNAFSLGEEEAQHLGVNTERTKRLLFILASVLTGLSVSISGMIGFVGLAVPHFVRMFVGSDYRILLVTSFLSGAAFLIFCDTLARTVIAPMELPVGVITGILGGGLFIYALNKRKIFFGR
ncbi:MAG: iron ABC transporter permease [Candidatus Omnitrophota bacterium]